MRTLYFRTKNIKEKELKNTPKAHFMKGKDSLQLILKRKK